MAGYVSTSRLARNFCRWYMRRLYFPLFDHHIAVSRHTAGELQSASLGHRKRRGVWIRPMGADCRLFTPERRCASFRNWLEGRSGAPERAMLLLYAGRLAPEKKLDLLLETMGLLEQAYSCQFHLLIAGEGVLRASMERICERDLPGAVYFLGHIRDREMLADIYANCDALLHPNAREPFGIAPLEAMASGLPVIGPNSGGITSYAGAGNAILVNADPESFAKAALLLRNDPGTADAIRLAGRATAERFDWSVVASSFFALAMVRGERDEPATAAAFYSGHDNRRRHLGWEL